MQFGFCINHLSQLPTAIGFGNSCSQQLCSSLGSSSQSCLCSVCRRLTEWLLHIFADGWLFSEGTLTPPLRIIDQWWEFVDTRWLSLCCDCLYNWFILWHNIMWNHPVCCVIVFLLDVFSIMKLIKVNVPWSHLSRKGSHTCMVHFQHESDSDGNRQYMCYHITL